MNVRNSLPTVYTKNLFWHKRWVDCGCLHVDVVAETMRAAKRCYHLAVHQLLRDQDNLRNVKLVDLIVNYRSNEFWREMKRVNSASSVSISVIDGHTALCLLQTHSKISTLSFYVTTWLMRA